MSIYDGRKVFSTTTALLTGLLAAPLSPPFGGGVGGGASSHQLAGYSLHGVLSADVLEQVGLGAEADADTVNVARRVEVSAGHRGLTEAAALQIHLEGAQLIEDDALTSEQTFLDVLLGSGKHSDNVGFRDGSGKLDVLGERLEIVVTRLHGTTSSVIDALITGRIGTSNNFVSNSHSIKMKNEK